MSTMSSEDADRMRAVVMAAFGDPEVLELTTLERPRPAAGELLVRLHAAGTNPVETGKRRDGSWSGITLPAILGSDASGVVAGIGAGVSEFHTGDEVFYMADFLGDAPGTYAEYHAVPAEMVAAKPAGLTHVEAASLPVAAGTAWEVVGARLSLRPGEWLLVHGAAGGVGGHAVQIAKSLGARVIGSAGPGRAPYLHGLGADVVLDHRAGDVAEAAAAAAGGELDAVADLVGDDLVSRVLPFVRERGRVASISRLEGDLSVALDRNLTLHGVLVRPSRTLLETIRRLVAAGVVKPLIDQVLPLERASAAHERLETGHGTGKVVLEMAP